MLVKLSLGERFDGTGKKVPHEIAVNPDHVSDVQPDLRYGDECMCVTMKTGKTYNVVGTLDSVLEILKGKES